MAFRRHAWARATFLAVLLVGALAAWSVWSLSPEARVLLGTAVTLAAFSTGAVFQRDQHRTASNAAFAIAVLAFALPVVLFVLVA
jgi:hypothetical protein